MWFCNLKDYKWNEVLYKEKDIPKFRSGHAFILYEKDFLIFGGKTSNIQETNDLWKFNPITLTFYLLHDVFL